MVLHEFPSWLSRRVACLLLAIFVALSIWALVTGPTSTSDTQSGPGVASTSGDTALYEHIIERVREGDDYYSAAIDEQRRADYPTWPPAAVRTPTLTWLHTGLGDQGTVWLLRLLVATTVVVATIRLEKVTRSLPQWVAATVLLVAGLGVYLVPVAASFHDVWAVVLCMLSVLVRAWSVPLAIVLGFTAVGVRELALPFLVLMGALTWRSQRRESFGWLGALGAFAGLYAMHWTAVSHAVGDLRVEGPSWLSLGGWPFVLDAVRFSSLLQALPWWVTVAVVPLAMLGWLHVRSGVPIRFLVHATTFMALLCVAGRANNVYWGTLFVAMVLPGLALAPRAVIALFQLLRSGRQAHGSAARGSMPPTGFG